VTDILMAMGAYCIGHSGHTDLLFDRCLVFAVSLLLHFMSFCSFTDFSQQIGFVAVQ